MWLKRVFQLFKKKNQETENKMPVLSRERIAMHEAAHGIVWYLFKEHWLVNRLTIDSDGLPEEGMNGALHITANFDVNKPNSVERANEIFAITLAGMIGQNIEIILNNDYLLIQLSKTDFNQVFDTNGCSGDFSIAKKYLNGLSQVFDTNEGTFTQIKVMDLVSLFQNHRKVQEIHFLLSQKLLEQGTLNREELLEFFNNHNFQDYIEEENLDINFYHKHK